MSKKRLVLFICIIAAVIVIIFGITSAANEYSISADTYYVTKVEYSSDHIDIHGGSTDSAKIFTGFYTYDTVGDTLFIRPYFTIVHLADRSGDFILSVDADKNKVTKVFLVGKSMKDIKLVWPGQ
ncbi:MAG TPA: hypothetical protein VHT96_12430 [Clostridia bacterium]|nr:hypothetical protein [Clostridia bacterium]